MARIVFSLTAAQVKTLAEIAKDRRGESRYGDYGSAQTCKAKGWLKLAPGNSWRVYRLTKAGRSILAMIKELKLDRQASGPEEGGP